MIQIDFENGKFQFERDTCTGEGYWVCVAGNVPGLLGRSNHNVSVPLLFGNILTSAARKMGHKKELLIRHLATPDEKKEKRRTVRVARKKKEVGISLDF